VIPPKQNGNFVAHMEMVLDIYKRPLDRRFPVVCMDESPKQLIGEIKSPISAFPGQVAKYDYEYKRYGVCNVFMACEPLAGKRYVKITERKTKMDWAYFLENISTLYPDAGKITLVMDNYKTHTPGALYEAFEPEKAKCLWDRFEFVFTPKHGSWLNMAEIELNVLAGQCLRRRIDNIEQVRREAKAWQDHRNNKNSTVNWQLTVDDARIKLLRLYPSFDN
jgi:transposase